VQLHRHEHRATLSGEHAGRPGCLGGGGEDGPLAAAAPDRGMTDGSGGLRRRTWLEVGQT
jgi:hypothetical protein